MALGHVATLSEWRRRPAGTIPSLDAIDVAAAREHTSAALARAPEGLWLPTEELAALVGCFGVSILDSAVVSSAVEADEAARRISGAVALKVVSDTIQHKSDVGGVVLGIEPEDVAEAYAAMADRIGPAMRGAIVQPMIGDGVEVIIGAMNDPAFGPVVMFGLGGTATELFADRAFSIVPVTDIDAAELVRAPRSAELLLGHRGTAAVDLAALEDVVLRVGRMVDSVPELAELDLNPVIARPDGVFIVDFRARLQTVDRPLVQPIRQLDRPAHRSHP